MMIEPKINRPAILSLISVLEDPKSVHTTHWNFRAACGCALETLRSTGVIERAELGLAQKALDIWPGDAVKLFGYSTPEIAAQKPFWRMEVGPEHVAKALRHFLETGVASSPYNFIS